MQSLSKPAYDETNVPAPEYRVRPVVRYVVTRYCHPFTCRDGSFGATGSSTVVAELTDERQADELVEALTAYEFKVRNEMAIQAAFGPQGSETDVSGSGCG